ncbi:hypothetical protein L1887_16328 [Cichorium endivia]|nr:hypothetical protein L1887_16328 [Cichorium endivia]
MEYPVHTRKLLSRMSISTEYVGSSILFRQFSEVVGEGRYTRSQQFSRHLTLAEKGGKLVGEEGGYTGSQQFSQHRTLADIGGGADAGSHNDVQ